MTVPPLAVADFAECFALLGGFFADMEGEGEEEGAIPFVWMPAGMGRFVLGCGGMTGGGMGVVLGAMATVGIGDGEVVVIDGWPGEMRRARAGGQTPRPVACDADIWTGTPAFSDAVQRSRLGRIGSGGREWRRDLEMCFESQSQRSGGQKWPMDQERDGWRMADGGWRMVDDGWWIVGGRLVAWSRALA